VVAEAGTGKSRLCYEFAERCRAREIPVYEAHGVAHGKAVPLLPVLEFFRGYFGITEHDTARAARDKIAGRMVLLDETLAEGLPLMFDFLGVPDPERPAPPLGPEARERQFRAHVHGRVARAIEVLYPDKLDERAALLAYHWEGAGEKWTAAQWRQRAADWMAGRDRREMDRHWRRVRTLLTDVPESPEALALGILARRNIIYNCIGFLLGRTQDEASTLFAEAMELATHLDDPGHRVRLLNAYALVIMPRRVDEALTHLRESFRLAEQTQNDFLRFIARLPLSSALATSGRLRERISARATPRGPARPSTAHSPWPGRAGGGSRRSAPFSRTLACSSPPKAPRPSPRSRRPFGMRWRSSRRPRRTPLRPSSTSSVQPSRA
jgi:hypothetical protein